MIDEIIDFFADTFGYIFGFEWLSDLWELIGSAFENIGEFSIYGLFFGILNFGFVFLLRDFVLNPFLKHMGPTEAIFWMVATYLACFVAGYFIGKHFENT